MGRDRVEAEEEAMALINFFDHGIGMDAGSVIQNSKFVIVHNDIPHFVTRKPHFGGQMRSRLDSIC